MDVGVPQGATSTKLLDPVNHRPSAKEGAKAAPILHDSLLTPPDGHHFTNQPNVGTLARHGGYPSSSVTDGFLFRITATPE